ncbi:MAG: hypothetical protein HGA45_05140 [Chloroflexales bacterium]|nr:hypothetical protein [Chloroflexales bacterium]
MATPGEPALGPLDRAAQIATAHTGGVAIGVEREGAGAIVEVTPGDGSEALVDLAQGRVLLVEPGRGGEGRGIEQQRVERARIAAVVVGGAAALGFDAAAARTALDAEPREVDLVWEEERLW